MTPSQPPTQSPPEYTVTIWETIAITVGAVVLVAIGFAGLGFKALNNAFSPGRAEAIARSIMTYDIPNGSEGLFGANVGGARVAVVASTTLPTGLPNSPVLSDSSIPPAIELLVARIPVSQETEEFDSGTPATTEFFAGFSFSYQVEGAFEVSESRREYRDFCGATTPITVQEGTLTLPDQHTRLPAVKYKINVDRDTDNYIANLTTVGQDAEQNVETVFKSLRCITSQFQRQSKPESRTLTRFTIHPDRATMRRHNLLAEIQP